MASLKIHGAAAAVVAVIFLAAVLPSHASATVDEPAKYKPAAPAPSPAPHYYSRPPVVQPVIIVQGVIYCKSCKLRGYNSGMDASPLPNATASLVCYGDEESKYRVLNQTSTATDKNGYFIVMVYDVDMFDRHSCRLYLRSSPTPLCAKPSIPTNPKLGLTLVRDLAAKGPEGARGVYHAKTALMYPGYFPPMDASPLPGAEVYLRCKHGRRALTVPGRSGPGGYFLIQMSQQMSAFTSQQCRVYVPRSPVRACGVPKYPAGRRGLPLKFQEFVKRDNGLQGMYSVGNRLFRPKYPGRCY
ncbi:hypothetical protein BAE44_0022627 [Dichanthelium oligosanthes]|uniref:Non-classical arabinogalactan protein 31 n=1 Tax=Dichanthelium oligosanthes TaxID=888268 RepID=A0A1E5UU06_9POAL|nr:hypothetical protein BAE44_0022627 [Dichanthelium oligosanthes]